MIQEYKQWLETVKRYPVNTVRAYVARAKKLLQHLTIKEVTKINVKEFVIDYTQNKSKSTLNGYINGINSFLEFLQKDFKVDVKQITIKRHLTDYFQEKVLKKRIVPVIEYHFENSLQLKTLFYFMFYTGARLSDVTNLHRQDIDLEERCVLFKKGKGEVDRTVPFTEEVKNLLVKYFEVEPEKTNAFNIGYSTLGNYCYEISDILGDLRIHPHTLRHSFARWYLDVLGGTMDKLKVLMGHKDIKTTQEYANIKSKDLIDDYKRREQALKNRKEKKR